MTASERWVIVDLDRTLVDSEHRWHLIPDKKERTEKGAWTAFEHPWYNDQPYDDVYELLRALDGKFKIAIVTSRHERNRETTITWLVEWGVHFDELHMRAEDGVPSSKVKGAIVMKQFVEAGRDVLFALDDHEGVVEVYTWIGVPTFYVRR